MKRLTWISGLIIALIGTGLGCKMSSRGDSALKDNISVTERTQLINDLQRITGKRVILRDVTLPREKADHIRTIFGARGLGPQYFTSTEYIELKAKPLGKAPGVDYYLNVLASPTQPRPLRVLLYTVHYDEVKDAPEFFDQVTLTDVILRQSVALVDALNTRRGATYVVQPPMRPSMIFDTSDAENYNNEQKRNEIVARVGGLQSLFNQIEPDLRSWTSPLKSIQLVTYDNSASTSKVRARYEDVLNSLVLNLGDGVEPARQDFRKALEFETAVTKLEGDLAKEFRYGSFRVASRATWEYSMPKVEAAVTRLRAIKDQISERFGFTKLSIGLSPYFSLPFSTTIDFASNKLDAQVKVDETDDLAMLPGYFGAFLAVKERSPDKPDAYRLQFSTRDGETTTYCESDGTRDCTPRSAGVGDAEKIGWTPNLDRLIWQTKDFVPLKNGLKLFVVTKDNQGKVRWRQEFIIEK